MKKRIINKIAIIGSGIMGSGIACHFANIGVEVLLLDIVPNELSDEEKKKELSLDNKIVRNRIVNDALKKALKSKPNPLYSKNFIKRIVTGNLNDDVHKIKEVDWIMEVVVERLDIKNNVFKLIEKYRTPGTLITTNTSGIPIKFMSKGKSEDFQKHFCGTHFFNPARYLKLFEIIPGPKTDTDIIEFLYTYGKKFLGKTSVVAKDTPAFIGNRIGIFGIQSLFHQIKEINLTVEEVDKLTGPLIGRPKSATFRTVDVVGLDTLAHVAKGIFENCPHDEAHNIFELPDFINYMIENNLLGSKSGKGFYKKEGKEIFVLDINSLKYREKKRIKFDTLEKIKSVDHVIDRFKILIEGKDKAAKFYRKNFASLFAYVSNRVPEISDKFFKIDDAMKSGFGWEHGPFQIWDAIGVKKGLNLIEKEDLSAAKWVHEMIDSGHEKFYTIRSGVNFAYNISKKKYEKIKGQEGFIILDNIRKTNLVFKNQGLIIEDLGDGILNCEFTSKMNTIGPEVLIGLNKGIDIAEESFDGLVIGNQSNNFSVGANLGVIFIMAVEQEYDELNMAIKYFQDTMMRIRYSSIPIVAAPHGMTLGGGCELTMHADKAVAAAETYIGLVEFGVGLIPGGGGSKEMAMRASDSFRKNDVELNILQEYFLNIGMAKVATSAHEAFDLGIFKKEKDSIIIDKNSQIATAKSYAKLMSEQGYTKPLKRNEIKVLGKQALGMLLVGIDSMHAGKFISDHDQKIANKLAYVMAGGDLSEPTFVSEQYLLDIEREAFLSLCSERKTLERIQHMLKTGKPLRN